MSCRNGSLLLGIGLRSIPGNLASSNAINFDQSGFNEKALKVAEKLNQLKPEAVRCKKLSNRLGGSSITRVSDEEDFDQAKDKEESDSQSERTEWWSMMEAASCVLGI